MSGLDLHVPSGLRASLRVTLAEKGIPGHAVDEVTDLAVFAVTEAFGAIDRVIARGHSNAVRITALSVAVGTAEALLRSHAEAMAESAKANGMRVTEAMVSVGAAK